MIQAKKSHVTKALIARAISLVSAGYSDAYIESVMWAERDMHTSLLMVCNAITVARAKHPSLLGTN